MGESARRTAYVTNAQYREWWDTKLRELEAFAMHRREVTEWEAQIRLPLPEVCPWMNAQRTLERYAALKQLVKEAYSEESEDNDHN